MMLLLKNKAYLFSGHANNIGQFLNDKIYALYAWFFQSWNLLLDNGLKGHVGSKETNSDTLRIQGRHIMIFEQGKISSTIKSDKKKVHSPHTVVG